MPLDSDTLWNSDAALDAARALTSTSPSEHSYSIIAAANVVGPPSGLLDIIAARTGQPLEGPFGLAFAANHIKNLQSLLSVGPAERLAMDALEQVFAWGVQLRTLPDSTLMSFTGTHWAPLRVQDLRSILTPMVLGNPERYGAVGKTVGGAIAIIRDLAPHSAGLMTDPPKPVVAVQNGELWIGKDGAVTHRIHRPETGLRYRMPVAFDPEATCPLFDKMLLEIFSNAAKPEAMVEHVLELMGYGIQGVRDLPVIAWFWGDGANGKSSLLKVLQAVVGQAQVWAGSLGALSGDRFMLPNMSDKLLFIEDDAKDGERLNDGLLKKIAENKVIDSRRVRSTHGTSFQATILPVIAMNGAPLLDDVSHGMRRRLQVIPFGRTFASDEMDPTLAQRIIDTELPGVLNRFLEGLGRLRTRGAFAPPAECEKAKDALLAAANPLRSFLDERCRSEPGARLRLAELYAGFVEWQRAQGQRVPFPRRGLKARLVSFGYTVRKSEGRMIVEGLALVQGAD